VKPVTESQREERMCIPEYLSFDRLNLILIAYLKAGADKKAVSYRDASVRSGVPHTIISGNNKFFVYSGFLVEEGKGVFRLTERGTKYAQLLDWGRLDEAKSQLGSILKECSLTKIAVDYITLNKEASRDDLGRKIGSIVGVSKAKRFTAGINTIIDMLVFSGLLFEENNMLRRGVEKIELPEITPSPLEDRRTYEFPAGLIPKKPKVSVPISLTVSISDATDIQKLREILKAIKEELFEEKETPD
jgi:hypothetical protein